MHECWKEPYSLRPIFAAIVGMLEAIMESDSVRRKAHLKNKQKKSQKSSFDFSLFDLFIYLFILGVWLL